MRLCAFKQFLLPFQTVTISNMTKTFGVSEQFIIKELEDYI